MFATVVRLSRGYVPAFAAIGVLWGSFAAVVPEIKAATGAGEGTLGLAFLCAPVGSILATAIGPRLGARIGAPALPVFGAVMALGAFLPLLAQSVALLALVMLLLGSLIAFVDITVNLRLSDLETRTGLHLMNFNHAAYSASFALAALAAGLARQAGVTIGAIMPVAALAMLVLALATRPTAADYRAPEPATPGGAARSGPMPWLLVLLTAMLLVASFLGEISSRDWSALHIEQNLGGAAGLGSYGPFLFGAMMAVGRLSGQVLAARLGSARLIVLAAMVAVLGALVLALAPSVPLALAGVAALGLGASVMVPTANSMLGQRVAAAERPPVMARAWMLGFLALIAGPAAIGGIAELAGLSWSFAAVACVIALAVPAALALGRIPLIAPMPGHPSGAAEVDAAAAPLSAPATGR